MYNFDFHILEPAEFEKLVADLVTARENAAKRTNFVVITQNGGPDKGVDFKLNNGKIIGQAKRIKNEKDLLKILKKEVSKVKALMPERYILIVSNTLSFQQRDKIKELFSPFIQEDSDLLDKSNLNNLLEKHKDVLLKHNKLWLSNTHILQEIISEAINKALTSLSEKNTIAELQEISRVGEYFVSTSHFPEGMKTLRKKGFLIITGDPGIGKTTLARALCHYFMEEGGYHQLFYHHGINPPLYMPDVKEKSIFFLDDFLGSNTYDKARIENISFFEQFIDKLYADGHLLIVTTREYIYQQEKKVNPRFRQLDTFKQIISLKEYSREEKLQILLNNVAKAELPYPAVQSMKTYADSIINSPNYQPKLIADFLKRRNYTVPDMNQWGWFLYHYIIVPTSYWEISFLSLSDGARLFVLCLFISGQPAYHDFLFDTFRSIARFRHISKPGYEGDVFHEVIHELKDTFINIDKDTTTNELVFSFTTTATVDFLLNYINEHKYLAEPLIKGAITFDQLFFAFTTKRDEYLTDEDSGEWISGNKILLNQSLKEIFIEKLITEFDTLKEEKVDSVHWSNGSHLIQKRYREINRVKWLSLFVELFNPNTHFKVLSFLKKKVKEIFFWEDDSIYLHDEEKSLLPDLILQLRNYLTIDIEKLISNYCWNANRTEDYISFYKLRNLAPLFFDAYVQKHKTRLYNNLKDLIESDIFHFKALVEQRADYYKWMNLQKLFDETILKTYKLYKLTLSKNAWSNWLKLAGMAHREMKIKTSRNLVKSVSKEKKIVDIKKAVDNVLPLPEKKLSREELHQQIANIYPDKIDKIMTILEERKYLYKIIRTELQVEPIIDYCLEAKLPISKQQAGFIKDYCSHELLRLSFSERECTDLIEFVNNNSSENLIFFRKNDMYESARMLDLDRLVFDKILESRLVILNNTYYSFILPEVKYFFQALSFVYGPDKITHYKSYTYNPDDELGNLLPYINRIDQKNFLTHFVLPRLTNFYNAVNRKDHKKLIIRYLKYFGAKLEYKVFRKGTKCTITVTQNYEISLLLEFLNFWIGEELFKRFPFHSSFVMSEQNKLNCNNLINHLNKTQSSDQTIKMDAITDEMFWEFVLLTDWAQTIKEEIPAVKQQITRLQQILEKYKTGEHTRPL